jgi:hypothetical protein
VYDVMLFDMLTSFVCCVNIGSLWHLVVVSDQHQLLKHQVRFTSPTFNPHSKVIPKLLRNMHCGTNRLIFEVLLLSVYSITYPFSKHKSLYLLLTWNM